MDSGSAGGRKSWPIPELETKQLPKDHADPFGPPICGCWLCAEWQRRQLMAAKASSPCAGHARSCMCDLCQERRRREILLLIVENIRDIWTELSWCAMEEQWDRRWTEWALEEFSAPSRSRGWWSSQSTHYPMAYWYARWDAWRKSHGIPENLKPVQRNMRDA